MSTCPATRRTVRARRRQPSAPLERDERLELDRLEHELTEYLADLSALDACAELSGYLDAIGSGDRVLALVEVKS